jgi:MFS-type transporter involved in bile tolerance (Atg22 family)
MELGWCIGITIVTPGFLKTKMALRAYEHEVGQLVSCLIFCVFILPSFLIINKILHFKYKLNTSLLNEVKK